MNNYFSHLIGQDNVKKKLNFYIKAYEATSTCPFLNLVGAKGLGKDFICERIRKELKNKDGSKRPFLELELLDNKKQRAILFADFHSIDNE